VITPLARVSVMV